MEKGISQEMLKMFENKIRAMNGQEALGDSGFENSNDQKSNNQLESVDHRKALRRKKAVQFYESLGKHRYPRVFFMNNLLKLSKKLSLAELEPYIYMESEKIEIPYTKVMLYFGVEKIVDLFYQKHEITHSINERYAFQEIERNLFSILSYFKTKDKTLVHKVIRGACRRFGADKYYSENWLTNRIAQKKKSLQSVGVPVNDLLKKQQKPLGEGKDYPYLPINKQFNLNSYIKEYPELNLQTAGRQRLENPEVKHSNKQMYYWFKKKPSQDSKISEEDHKHQNQKISFPFEDDQPLVNLKKQPIPIKFQVVIQMKKVDPSEKIYSSIEKQVIRQESYGSEEVQSKSSFLYQENNEKRVRIINGKAFPVQSLFSIRITPEKVNNIIMTLEKSIKKIAKDLSLPESNVQFIFNKKDEYKKIIDSNNRELMEANSILVDKEENKTDDIPQEMVFYILDNKMKKFLSKAVEFDMKDIQNECEKILKMIDVNKSRHKGLIKSWLKKFTDKQ